MRTCAPYGFARVLSVSLALWCGTWGSADASTLYKWKDANGQTHYSQTPPPDKAVEYDTSRVEGEVREELKPYCVALGRFSMEVFYALDRGAPLNSVISISRSVEMDALKGKANRGQLQEVANYVNSLRHSDSDAAQIATLVENSCLRGGYGGRAFAKSEGGAAAPGGRSGTGWFVDSGVVVTSLHVVEGKEKLTVITASGEERRATVYRRDADHDLALLSVSGANDIPGLAIAADEARLGTEVFTMGFPHTGVMGVKPKLTTGVISARSGMQDDPDTYQISVPVQAGNSGGPLLDASGYVVGIVASKLSAGAMYRATQDVTENVNYAIKAGFARELAGSPDAPAPAGGSRADIAERVERSVVRVLAE